MPTYWGNEDRYVSDLNEAAAYAQATGDWSRYVQIQRVLASESALSVLAPYAGELGALSRDRALKEAESRHPGFGNLLKENRDTLKKERPALEEAIAYAETDPRLQDKLLDLYDCANDYIVTHAGNNRGPQSATARRTGPSLTLREINKLPITERHKVLDAMRVNLGDTPVDVADTSSETNLHY